MNDLIISALIKSNYDFNTGIQSENSVPNSFSLWVLSHEL
jgi:hypothetical protein